MKRWILATCLMLGIGGIAGAQLSVAPPPILGAGFYGLGSQYFNILNTASLGNYFLASPPSYTLYGYNSGAGKYYPMAVDASGNLILTTSNILSALALVCVIPFGMVLPPLLKIVFVRHRPYFVDPILIFQDYSFPSGHALAATLLYGLFAVFTVLAFDTWLPRALAILGASVMILLIGFSRLYLGAHYLSDVLGGVAAGVAWLALSLTVVDTLRRNPRCH